MLSAHQGSALNCPASTLRFPPINSAGQDTAACVVKPMNCHASTNPSLGVETGVATQDARAAVPFIRCLWMT
jgi:hypothetical protein